MKLVIHKAEEPYTKLDSFVNWCSKYFEVLPTRKNAKKKDKNWCKNFATADFETTNDKEIKEAFVYAWSFCFMGRVLIGRDMKSFNYFLEKLSESLGDTKLVIYWHNYSFDWSFESGYYHYTAKECFFTQPRKILYARQFGNIENRCSYLLTGLNLANLTKQMNVKHKKKSGEKFDYSKYRTPYTDMKKYELIYLRNDTRGLWESLVKFYETENDTVRTIPYTKTGFVRRDINRACETLPYSMRMGWQLDYEAYKACKEAFRGGNTHANRRYAEENTIVENVNSNDFCSAYPSAMLSSSHFPRRNFYHKGPITLDECKELLNDNKCAILRVHFSKIKLRDRDWGCPYLAFAKCRNVVNHIPDNGRILKAEALDTTITDLDLRILFFEYEWSEMIIYDSFFSQCAPLPEAIRKVIMKYFKNKTELKGVTSDDGSTEAFYQNQKEKLNASYGNCVMDSIQTVIEYDDQEQEYSDKLKRMKADVNTTDAEIEEYEKKLLRDYNKKGVLPYSVGVFVTSICRFELEKCLALLPVHSFVYADTDSIKYTGVDHSIFDNYNKHIIDIDNRMGLFADTIKGERKYLGLFELETKEPYKEFSTLGAKKYCYIDQDGTLHLTCAGVNKKKGGKELEENGGIKAFKNGFIFRKSGGITATYNDKSNRIIYRDGKPIEIRKNIYLEESTYTVGQTEDYRTVIDLTLKAHNGTLENYEEEWYI